MCTPSENQKKRKENDELLVNVFSLKIQACHVTVAVRMWVSVINSYLHISLLPPLPEIA